MATTAVFLPGESQGWWSLVGCRLWGRAESDTTEVMQQQQQQQLPGSVTLISTILGQVLHLFTKFRLLQMAPHSSTPVWKIPWTEEPGRLQSMRSLRVGYD